MTSEQLRRAAGLLPRDEFLAKLSPGQIQQSGRTTEILLEAAHSATSGPKPIDVWIMCESWWQGLALQSKFLAIVAHENTQFDKSKQVVKFHNGSVVRFKTAGTRQPVPTDAIVFVDHRDVA